MIQRAIESQFRKYLSGFPVVALLGPRQCGKSTLAKEMIQNDSNWIYFDMERPSDLKKLEDAELFFISAGTKCVCIDEVQLRPDLFPVLRAIIDADRREGRILLLGSASPELLRQGSETLAGRISFLELTPFTLDEISHAVVYRDHWLKGGYPPSVLQSDTDLSMIWREDFIRTFVERDLPMHGIRTTAVQITRLLTMCAHSQGQIFNHSKICESLGLSRPTITNLLDVLQQSFILRKLEPFESNVKKRLVKSPKYYVRDSGIMHALLGIDTFDSLLGNPALGNSWEGYCVENILAALPRWKSFFYRSTQGAEIDLIISKGEQRIAIEFKASLAPSVSKGFWSAIDDIQPQYSYVVIPDGDSYPIRENVTVISIRQFLNRITELTGNT